MSAEGREEDISHPQPCCPASVSTALSLAERRAELCPSTLLAGHPGGRGSSPQAPQHPGCRTPHGRAPEGAG